jgi:hypothetical protein
VRAQGDEAVLLEPSAPAQHLLHGGAQVVVVRCLDRLCGQQEGVARDGGDQRAISPLPAT